MICIFIACTNVDECKSVHGFFKRLTWIRDVYEHEMFTTQEKWAQTYYLVNNIRKRKKNWM